IQPSRIDVTVAHILGLEARRGPRVECNGTADCVIHPAAEITMCEVEFFSPLTQVDEKAWAITQEALPRFQIACTFGCLDAPPQREQLDLTAERLGGKLAELGLAGPTIMFCG